MEKDSAGLAAGRRASGVSGPRERAGDAALLGRFAAGRDEEAFAELVRRHGPMVLGVCRRVLRDREAAQDAFQVTFLVLARKAGEVGRPELLANWLYGVAYRTALRVRDRAARRGRYERQGAAMPEPEQPPPPDTTEALALLDEEMNYLPEMYRTLLVLCYLEGKTHEEAARQLAVPVGSMSWRMNRARELLHRRLARRGVALTAAALALLLSGQRASAAAVGDGLAEDTARAAADYAGGAPGAVPHEHGSLTEEVLGGLGTAGRGRAGWLALALLLALLAGGVLSAGAAAAGAFEPARSGPAHDGCH